MEYDDKGNLVKETETITEYEKAASDFPVYPRPYPYQPTWISGTTKSPPETYTIN